MCVIKNLLAKQGVFLRLPHLNEFRTVKWQDLFDFPETSLNQMRQLLDQPEWVV